MTEKNLQDMSLKALTEHYNAIAEDAGQKPVKKFASKAKAIARIEKLGQHLNEEAQQEADQHTPQPAPAPTPKPQPGRARKRLTPEERQARQQDMTEIEAGEEQPAQAETEQPAQAESKKDEDQRKIRVLEAEPGKRGKAKERFKLYRDGMTVADYIEAVGDANQARRDIRWDAEKGFIRLSTRS